MNGAAINDNNVNAAATGNITHPNTGMNKLTIVTNEPLNTKPDANVPGVVTVAVLLHLGHSILFVFIFDSFILLPSLLIQLTLWLMSFLFMKLVMA